MGTVGLASHTSGGTTDMSSRCSIMCALSITSANASSGEPIASHKIAMASRKVFSRHRGNCAGRVLRIASHPRQYTAEVSSTEAESQ